MINIGQVVSREVEKLRHTFTLTDMCRVTYIHMLQQAASLTVDVNFNFHNRNYLRFFNSISMQQRTLNMYMPITINIIYILLF